MGFPVGYSEFMLPKIILQLVFLLGHVRRLISWIFEAVGLGDLILESEISTAIPAAESTSAAGGEARTATAALIQEMLPVAFVRDLAAEGWNIPEACAVCLQEFCGGEEVRRPGNCRHIFHRSCIDRWMEHDQRTCPLCRTPLVPEDLREAFDGRIWSTSPISYWEGFDIAAAGEDDPAFSLIHQFLAPPLALSS